MFTSKMNERYNEKGRIQIRPFMLSLVVATVQHMGVNRVIDTVSYWFLVHAVNATILLFDCYLR